ncbi:MAG: carbamoyl-phosphate synthase large subunit [Chthonomonas sp.]|nr:carbamoyl-phosphate synthase large subunit [Chthonomonas sp.]
MKPTVLVLGSGPIRIGQGIEFDYSCVHCVWALQELGYRAIILNNNPETVSTDFDTGDGLYFEPVTLDDVLRVARHENVVGIVCQFGGQTAINLAEGLHRSGETILGTGYKSIARAEDRSLFDAMLQELGINRPAGRAARSLEEALDTADSVGYPVLVRPSYVLGGRAMEICFDREFLTKFYAQAEDANPGQPVLVDRYVQGSEAEVDVISDGVDTLVPGIMEHIERAGVHSGDSMAVYPPVGISRETQWRMVEIACDIARTLEVKGLMNIQFVVDGDDVYVIEVNPRASRTVPYLSKVSGIPMVQLATRAMMGEKLKDLGYGSGLWCADGTEPSPGVVAPRVGGKIANRSDYVDGRLAQSHLFAVKAPVFSFQKLSRVEPSLGPEMKSTGEILGIDRVYEAALYKALVASHIQFKPTGLVVLTVNPRDREGAIQVARELTRRGYSLAATEGTHAALASEGIEAQMVKKLQEGSPNLLELIQSGQVSLMINTPSGAAVSTDEAKSIRRACIEAGVACVTNIDTAKALATALDYFANPERSMCLPYTEYLRPATVAR